MVRWGWSLLNEKNPGKNDHIWWVKKKKHIIFIKPIENPWII